jgi:AraC-like DNA-binding protein/mannose-6-phosphate isomerase-like protein (cupin superfamily)
VDERLLHETKIHGTVEFPFAVYLGRVPEYITAFPRHWHEEAELIYVTAGRLNVSVWAQNYLLEPGDIVIVLPHAIHAIEQAQSEKAEYYNIMFNFSLLGEDRLAEKYLKPFLTHEKNVNCMEPAGSELNLKLKPLLESLIEHRNDSYSTHEYLVKSNLLMVMHLLNQHCVETGEKDLALHMTYDQLKPALDWVQLSYAMDTPVQYVADLCGFSTSYFMKLFKDLMGTGFTAYLNNYRLELAAYQLAVEDLNVIEVASNCGFHNHSYFTRAFVKKYGMTPVKYRKSCQHR